MRLKVEHRLGIRAPAEAIWAVIADIERWSEWNPLHPKAEGIIRMGASLVIDVSLAGQPTRTIRPMVVDWVPNEQIIWRQTDLGGLVKSTRYIEIEQLSETGCIFSNGAMWEGWIGPTMARRLRGPLRAGFAAMGEAVKARAEQMWRPEGSDPTLAP